MRFVYVRRFIVFVEAGDGILAFFMCRGLGDVYRRHFFFQAEDGIRDFCLSRGLGDVYKGQRVAGVERGVPRPGARVPPRQSLIHM